MCSLCNILKIIVALVVECDIAVVFENVQDTTFMRTTLIEMAHVQLPTAARVNDTLSHVFMK